MPARSGLWLGGYLGATTYLGPTESLGRAGDTSSATSLGRAKRRPVAQVVEVGLARPVARRKLRGVGQPGEVSSADRVRSQKRRRIGPGKERQRARPLTRRRVLEPVVEHDAARPLRPVKVRRIGQAFEVSTVTTFYVAGTGYGVSPYGVAPYGDGLVGTRRKRRRVGPGKDRQRARPINPT